MDQDIFLQEKAHLDKVLCYIRQTMVGEAEAEALCRQEIIEERRRIWDDYSRAPDTQELIQANDTLSLDTDRYLRLRDKFTFLKKILYSPYFARIDFREKGFETVEPLYIGSLSLIEKETSDVLICDWRADVASLFYDAAMGSCRYKSPMGYIEGEILLRRQLKTENGELLYFFDTDTNITDWILQDELGKSSDTKMKTIVRTIQKEQNQVIRNATADLLLVQGSSGSGKTSVALHRLAYLLYKYRKSLQSGNVLIFSPSEIFSAYIEDVLPELGEERAVQEDLFHYFSNFTTEMFFFGKADQYERLFFSKNEGLKDRILKKGTEVFAHKLEAFFTEHYLEYLHLDDIRAFDKIVCDKTKLMDLYFNVYNAYPPYVRTGKILSRILDFVEEKHKTAQLFLYKKQITQNGLLSLGEEELTAECEQLWQEEISRLTEEIRGALHVDCFSLYVDFLKAEYPELAEETKNAFAMGSVYYEDLFPLVWLRLFSGETAIQHRVQQIVIDEAQEYSPLQYLILARLFKNAKFTILGDPAQAGLNYFDTISEIGHFFPEKKDVAFVHLEKSYRSTWEINAFLQKLHPGENRLFFERHGKEPEMKQTSQTEDTLCELLQEYYRDGCRTTMIVCRTGERCRQLYNALQQRISVCLVEEDGIRGQSETMILPAYFCKGLEADGVIVIDWSSTWEEKIGDNLLYVACSRALHRLTLLQPED